MPKKDNSYIFAAFCLISIAFILWLISIDTTQFYPDKSDTINKTSEAIQIKTTRELISIFNKSNYTLPHQNNDKIPDIFLPSIPKDFKNTKDVAKKKSVFIRLMIPLIIAEQKNIRQKRLIAQLILKDARQLTHSDSKAWFERAIKEYKINSKLTFLQKKSELIKRLDELPLTLILAQAAIESAWGTSRFAIEGNSLFGQWTFSGKNGLTPKDRSEGKTHQVKAFPSLQASIRSYLKNINRNNAYKELRDQREKMRINNEKLDAFILAEGLHRYSQKGTEYVKIVRRLLNTSEFKSLENI